MARYVRSSLKGDWFESKYHGTCSNCFDDFDEGDEIRADGQGGWEARQCCGDDHEDAE